MDLDRAQAEWSLGLFPSEDLPELAAQMMMRGFDSPAILELASFHRPGRFDVPSTLVDRAFQDCGRPPLSHEKATLQRVLDLLRADAPASHVLSAFGRLFLSSVYAMADDDGPLSEMARLYVDWEESDDPLMLEALEDHVGAVGRRILDYFG